MTCRQQHEEMEMAKQTLEQMIDAELRRIKVALKDGKGAHDCLYGAQQALSWLKSPNDAGAPAKVFRRPFIDAVR